MTGQEKSDLLIQATVWAGLTVAEIKEENRTGNQEHRKLK